jgi:hypothetical protein
MTMKDEKRTEYVTRDAILKLLSDDEVAKVSTAEAASLTEGEEYLDLEHLEQGVRRARPGTKPARVLPRGAVQEATWRKILVQLSSHGIATHP